MFPPFWKQDSHYVTVEFSREFNLDREETITIACEGQFNLMLDGKLQFGQPKTFTVPQGKHKLNLKVWNQATPPALFIEGATIHTDSTWLATYEDMALVSMCLQPPGTLTTSTRHPHNTGWSAANSVLFAVIP